MKREINKSTNSDRETALIITAQYNLLESQRNIELKCKEFEIYRIRLVSKQCAQYISSIDHVKKYMIYNRVSKTKTRRMCKACACSGRMAMHHGLCRHCRPTFAPEVSRGIMRKKFGIPSVVINKIPWRRSTVWRRKVSLASQVWGQIKLYVRELTNNDIIDPQDCVKYKLTKMLYWKKQGEQNFFKAIFKNNWNIK